METATPERLISADDHVDVSHDAVKAHLAAKYHAAYDAGLMAFARSAKNIRSVEANALWREQHGLADMDVDGVEASVSYCEVSAFRYLYLIEDGWRESTRAFNLALNDFASAD